MLRLHFTSADLLRIRVAQAPNPLWEIVLSLHVLQSRDGGLIFDQWRRRVSDRLHRDDAAKLAWRFLASLAPATSYFPDFLTPIEANAGFENGLDELLVTPRSQLRRELELFASVSPPPPHALPLAQGRAGALKALGKAVRTYHDLALAPHWDRILLKAGQDRAVRTKALADDGIEGFLAGFETMSWRDSALDVEYPVDRELHLDGRGLVFVPSVFCWRTPIATADPDLPPTLVYPVENRLGWSDPSSPGTGVTPHLSALLGHTRAAILYSLADKECATGELATLTSTAASTVSRHTAVLREAGLIESLSSGRFVIHRLTSLGAAFFEEPLAPAPRGAQSLS